MLSFGCLVYTLPKPPPPTITATQQILLRIFSATQKVVLPNLPQIELEGKIYFIFYLKAGRPPAASICGLAHCQDNKNPPNESEAP
jgi:hypothetical protein